MFKKIIFLGACATFSFLIRCPTKAVLADNHVINEPAKPTILATVRVEEANNNQIQINGLTASDSQILIYINGKYDGMANISIINADVSKFSYLSSQFNSDQPFEVMALAQNPVSGLLSAPALAQVNSIVEQASLEAAPQLDETIKPANPENLLAPPKLLTPQQANCLVTPYISGTAPSSSLVSIYIDDRLFKTVKISNQLSGASFFSFSPKSGLERGDHVVYAVSQDLNGNKSGKSNILTFCVSNPKIAATSTAANINDQPLIDKGGMATNSTLALVSQKTSGNSSGNSHKNAFNVIVFIIFVLGLVAWMVVVNKDLAAERFPGTETNNNQPDQNAPQNKQSNTQ